MITYELRCDKNHSFEGWFANREVFEDQLERQLISCPVCESRSIEKRLSRVAVHTSKGEKRPTGELSARAEAAKAVGSYLRTLADFVENNFEDVGASFADEARKIQAGEAAARNIRGTTTEGEEESLKEEGVDFVKIALPKYDA